MSSPITAQGDRRYYLLSHYRTGGCCNPKRDKPTAVIAAKHINLSLEQARALAKRALRFKLERGRLPSLTAADPWEKQMAEGVAFLQRKVQEETRA